MTQQPKRLFIAGLLAATLGATAIAQTPAAAVAAPASAAEMQIKATPGERHGHRKAHKDPAKFQQRMAERHAKHMGALKEKLKITPAQENAWNHYSASMQPPTHPARDGQQRMDRDAFAQLSTPERIDRMQAMHAQRDAAMRERGESIKAFYAQLTPEQQTTFDAETLRHGKGGHRGHPKGSGKHRG